MLTRESIELLSRYFENVYTRTRLFFLRSELPELKPSEKLELIDFVKLQTKPPQFKNILGKARSLYEKAILKAIEYIAYFVGIFEEILVLSQLLANKSRWTKRHCVNFLSGSAIPHITLSFRKSEILLSVFSSNVDVEYLRHSADEMEKRFQDLKKMKFK